MHKATMAIRIAVTAALLLAIHAGASWISHGYTLTDIEPPKGDLKQLPIDLGPWHGENVEADPRITGFLQALAEVDRKYRDPAGNEVFVHAVWTDDYVRLHFPEQCYVESGWTQRATQQLTIPVADGRSIEARIVSFDRDEQPLQVLYWFQMGDRFIQDRWQHRAARQELCWGQKTWPPLVKVMLQTSAPDPQQGQARLEE